MAKNPKYFKLGAKSSVYFDTLSKMKVSKNVPGIFKGGKPGSKMQEAINNGHIVEIKEEEYKEMMAKHKGHITKNNAQTARQHVLRKTALGKAMGTSSQEEPEEEIEEEIEEEEEVEDNSELIQKIMDDETIPKKYKKKLENKTKEELDEIIQDHSTLED